MQEYFDLLNDQFDKIYVLSVEAAVERRKFFSERFVGLHFSFFFGADKTKFDAAELEAAGIFNRSLSRKNHRYGKPMNPGEVACSWSHKMIYEDMLKNNYKRIFVFEDDAVPDVKTLPEIPGILSEIPDDCEVLMWGWGKNSENTFNAKLKKTTYHFLRMIGLMKWNHTIIHNMYARKFSKHLKTAGFHDYTYAYSINRSGAEKLLKMQTPIQFTADNLLAHAATKVVAKTYIAWPKIFLHDNLPDGTPRDSYIRDDGK
jgi:glycosyl transferase family 25